MNNFSRKFGIELEITSISRVECLRAIRAAGVAVDIEAYNHNDYADHWKIVNDASVLGGFELVSPILDGQAGLNEALRVADAISTAGASANKTCWFHVHFDASSMSVAEIRMICKRYAAFEGEIDGFMPVSRRGDNNRYCKSVVQEFSMHDFNTAENPVKLAEAQIDRYFKINLKAYLRHHTIEFRQHSGTANPEKIKNWILFLNDFINESIRIANSQGGKLQKHWQNLIDLISENDGMLASEIIARLGIQPHSLRGQISHMRAAGIKITTTRTPAGSIYRYCGAAVQDNLDALFNGVNTATKEFFVQRAAQLAA